MEAPKGQRVSNAKAMARRRARTRGSNADCRRGLPGQHRRVQGVLSKERVESRERMIKVKIFIVERYCPKDQETDRIKLCKKKGLIFPFKILVTDELDPCRNCGKRAWRIDGHSRSRLPGS